MITIQIEPADNGVVKFLIDDNVNGGGEEFTSRYVYDFDGFLGKEQQVKFFNDMVLDLGMNTGSEIDRDKLEIGLEWGVKYIPTDAEIKTRVTKLQKEIKGLTRLLKE
jgi:hypothetical protein|tara:strand:+ start:2768 stop:3091 length:324 start_codon:yes stop_codon:yes gene_type:complete